MADIDNWKLDRACNYLSQADNSARGGSHAYEAMRADLRNGRDIHMVLNRLCTEIEHAKTLLGTLRAAKASLQKAVVIERQRKRRAKHEEGSSFSHSI